MKSTHTLTGPPGGETTTGRRPRRPWWRRLARALGGLIGWLALLGALPALVSIADGGERSIPWILLAALGAWVTPVLVLAVVILALCRLRRSALIALLSLLVAVSWLKPYPHGGGHADGPPGGGLQLRVMTQNLLFGEADAPALVARVRAERPDVLMLTELTPDAVRRLDAAGLAELMPHRVLAPQEHASGSGLYSTHDLLDPGTVPGTEFAAVRARIELAGKLITVAAVHPTPPQLTPWAADHAVLLARFGPQLAAGEPVVLAGDFNATVFNGPFRRLLQAGFVDAGAAGAWAWQGQTWPTDRSPLPPAIRIDHVLGPRGTVVERVATYPLAGSDHRGLVATLRLPPA